ncbi:MAG: hypothetical protein AAF403_07055, partial [Pseudomonadota bacterium]
MAGYFTSLKDFCVVVPIAPDEQEHYPLLDLLRQSDAEIITASKGSRAKSLNWGANQTQKPFIWFVHADSRFDFERTSYCLKQAALKDPNALYYCDLMFDGPFYMRANAEGANVRSRLLGLPFGDQALMIARRLFDELGGYCETLAYGEDLDFVLRVKSAKIPVKSLGCKLTTNSRRYQQTGWLRLTMRYQMIWVSMYLKYLKALIKRF